MSDDFNTPSDEIESERPLSPQEEMANLEVARGVAVSARHADMLKFIEAERRATLDRREKRGIYSFKDGDDQRYR
jgi:lipoate-protein ligase A